MAVPDSLAERIALFSESAYAYQGADDLFSVNSWVFVMVGQRLMPRHFHRMGGMLGEERLRRALESLQAGIARGVASMPLHKDFLRSYCAAEKA
jgi:tryptophan halogenase